MSEPTEFDEERLLDGGTEVERLLLQSADLDRASEFAQRRTMRALEAGWARQVSGGRGVMFGGIAVAAGIALSLWIANQKAPPPAKTAQAEPRPEVLPAGPDAEKTGLKEARPDPCVKAFRADGKRIRIDQFSQNNTRVAEVEGRFGTWFVDNDGTGVQQPAPGAELVLDDLTPASPGHVLHSSGSVFKKWGASTGVQLAGGGCYDASVYDGLVFEARGPARVSVLVQTVDVVPVEEGGTCTRGCYASHYVKLQLSGKFERHEVRFDDLVQHKFGSAVDFDPARLRAIVFQVAPEDTPFDFAIAELSFMKN